MSAAAIERLISQRVADTLLDYEANRNRGNENRNGTENGNDNRNGSHDSRSGRTLHISCECTYKEFLNCQPLNFKRTEGAVGLAYWFEKIESVSHISNCAVECQVKYATCILLGGALTWVPILWGYTQCFQELALLFPIMVPDEEDKVERATPRDDHVQQPPYESQKVLRAYIAGPDEKKEYAGTLPLNYRSECPELKNQNRGNQAGSSEARGRIRYHIWSGWGRDNKVSLMPKLKGIDEVMLKVLAKVGTVAYKLELPQQLRKVHSTFHVSNLKKCLSDESLVILLDEIQIDDRLHFIEEPMEIMD
ncbi:hypothetical protein Tco_1384035 [Tanacetum coccineum]